MTKKLFVIQAAFIVPALLLGLAGWLVESTAIRWAAPAFALALVSVGLGLNSILIARQGSKKIAEMKATLSRIEELQAELQKQLKERQEQTGGRSLLMPTLETLSQVYQDYIERHTSEADEGEHPDDAEN